MITDALKRAGADVLANDSRRLILRNEKIMVVGIDDLWSRRAEPARAFGDVNSDDCTIVLAHNPDTALYARHLRPGVMLSGHTHGGVVRIPFYGSPLKSILRIGKEFYSGLNRYEDFYIYTNRGLGTFWLRIRINCPPEVSRFSLTPLVEATAAEKPTVKLHPLETRPRAVEHCAPSLVARVVSTSSLERRDARSRDRRRNCRNALRALLAPTLDVVADKIASIAPPGALESAHRTIDARGMLLIPGAVDPHTHLDAEMFSMHTIDDFESGTVAAAAGGVTTIVDYAFQAQGGSLDDAIEKWHAKARGRAIIDYSFHVALLDPSPEAIAEIPLVIDRGVTSIKIFMMQGFEARARDYMRAFKVAGDSGALLAIHAEDEHLIGFCTERLLAAGQRDVTHFAASRPPLSEAAAVRRALAMTEVVWRARVLRASLEPRSYRRNTSRA